jgi:aspartate/methionine/tyrosine aminotransferase
MSTTRAYVGLSSRDFALRLLEEKRCAVAPGSAFNTYDPVCGSAEMGASNVHDAVREESLQMLEGFCRVSLANSTENVVKGMNLLCDLLDELSAPQPRT